MTWLDGEPTPTINVAKLFAPYEQPVAPGVVAVTTTNAGDLTIHWIRATNPGSGDVSRWLDTLPVDRNIRFITVTNPRLAGMLKRRGFKNRMVLMPAGNEWVQAYIRRANR